MLVLVRFGRPDSASRAHRSGGPSHFRKFRNGIPAARLTHNRGGFIPLDATSSSISCTDPGRTAMTSISALSPQSSDRAIST